MKVGGGNIEAVLKLGDEENEHHIQNNNNTEGGGVLRLIDVQDNQFILSKGKDTTVPHEDHNFIRVIDFMVLMRK